MSDHFTLIFREEAGGGRCGPSVLRNGEHLPNVTSITLHPNRHCEVTTHAEPQRIYRGAVAVQHWEGTYEVRP
jgi:hypothetical protein